MRVLFCLIASVLLSLSPGERWYVRVVARSDAPAAQTEKIRVRDAVLRACPEKLQALPTALPRILAAAGDIAPDAAVTVRPWAPAGHPARPTLYVSLGEGAGRNWWGVLYEDAVFLAAEEGEAENAETAEIVWTWPVVDWLLSLLGF